LIIANYGVLLYESLGMDKYMPLLLSAIWVTASFPGNIFNGLFVDKFGRRAFLLTGLGMLVIVLTLECIMQAQFLGTTNIAGQRAAIFFIFLFIICWSFCMDATQFLYLSEIFPTHIRAQGMAVGMSGLYCATIILLIAGPTALNNITWKFFIVLIIPTAAQFLVIFFFAPETMQRSLEDISAEFGDKVAVHYYHATIEDEKQYDQALEEEMAQPQVSGAEKSSEGAVQMVERVQG
jgi:MFS family permease